MISRWYARSKRFVRPSPRTPARVSASVRRRSPRRRGLSSAGSRSWMSWISKPLVEQVRFSASSYPRGIEEIAQDERQPAAFRNLWPKARRLRARVGLARPSAGRRSRNGSARWKWLLPRPRPSSPPRSAGKKVDVDAVEVGQADVGERRPRAAARGRASKRATAHPCAGRRRSSASTRSRPRADRRGGLPLPRKV